jgi:hypothetical protein
MTPDHCCKVERVSATFDISPLPQDVDDIDEYLVERWLGINGNDSVGLRTLAEWFNKQILREVYREHGRSDSNVRINSDYDALQSDKIPVHEREELISELAGDGIDGGRISRKFISKSTLSRHLKNCLDVNKERSNSDTEWEIERIKIAKNTYKSHLESALKSLDNKEKINGIKNSEMKVQAYISCSECPTRVTIETAYDQGYVCSDHHDPQ